ncbi:unnamed protein product [Anisakis simplex]|uniref:Peptidase S1 domain-containing protein n=1 Tax=Anisakis simplex TaxID=6269 RepID=A0A0M3JZ16_ANISI|nr:unnamed protein product [Anisakis simplex]
MLVLNTVIAFIVLVLFEPVESIINGELEQWNRHGYLVKIFSREPNSNIVTSCSGSIISASLVLTAPNCIRNATTHERFGEVAVNVPTFRVPRTLRAEILNVTDAWALLKIVKLPVKDLCPPNPAPVRVSQLNVRVSLTKSSMETIDHSSLTERDCWITAFATTYHASTFLHQHDVRKIQLEKLKPSYDNMNTGAIVYKAAIVSNRTACWDDAGAALTCHTNAFGDVQVGIFHSLSLGIYESAGEVNDDETTTSARSMDQCSRAVSMNFALIANDIRLIRAIERNDLPAFVDVYDKCNFKYAENIGKN